MYDAPTKVHDVKKQTGIEHRKSCKNEASGQDKTEKRTFKCRNCGTVHGVHERPGYGKEYKYCHGWNHYISVCIQGGTT